VTYTLFIGGCAPDTFSLDGFIRTLFWYWGFGGALKVLEKISFGDHETARTSFGDRSPKLTLYALLPGIVGSVVSSFTRNSG
jgi:hypothetical protein